MKSWIEKLDHPLLFLLFLLLALTGLQAVLTWLFKEFNLPGPAALAQHP